MMDAVNSDFDNNSPNFARSSKHNHKLADHSDYQESVVTSVKQKSWEFKDQENGQKSLDKTSREENKETPLTKELASQFTVLDKSSADFVDAECICEGAKLVEISSSRKTPEELKDGGSQVNKSFDEACSENGSEDNFPKESSSERDSIDFEQSAAMDFPDSKKHYLSISDIQDFIDSRVAEARLEVVENKIDRVLMKIENIKDDHQKQLFHVLLARIKELEVKLDKKPVMPKKGNRLSELPVEQFSSYVVEKATQTPSEEHDCEGVYVLVSKKNKQQVRQVHRQVAYVLPGGSTEKSEEFQPKQPKATAKKLVKRVGYPEYLYEESLQGQKGEPEWNKFERKTVAFFPPIPRPYSRRRPRNPTCQKYTNFNCSKHH